MTTADIPPDDVLPCGCVLRCSVIEGVRTITYIPCRLDCRNYLNAVAMAEAADISIEKRRAP